LSAVFLGRGRGLVPTKGVCHEAIEDGWPDRAGP
jgi:hypothetical protein